MTLREEWDQWRTARLARVTSPLGNLALVETRWKSDEEEISLEKSLVGQPNTVTATEEERKDFDGKVVRRGVRLWDADSPAIRSFETIDLYAFDPQWIIEASFVGHPQSRPVPFEYIREDRGRRDLSVPGDVDVKIDGVEYKLSAFDDDGTLILSFADPTNGSETYPSGRFLYVQRIEGTDRVTLNFNRAFVPPCGFSIHYNCPLPPQQNRLHVPVRAGEKYPIFRDGYEIH
jgi:uncharacterized protein (DUF1684 family)